METGTVRPGGDAGGERIRLRHSVDPEWIRDTRSRKEKGLDRNHGGRSWTEDGLRGQGTGVSLWGKGVYDGRSPRFQSQ